MYRPPQCTEREPGGYEDCTWCSGVMLQNAAHGRAKVPSTRKEYEALRVAGGDGPAENPGDGSNIQQLQIGFRNRYDWTPVRIGVPNLPRATFAQVWSRLQPGTGAVVQGAMGVLGDHWNRWDPKFGQGIGAHAAYAQREKAEDRVWWMNPLAPNSYAGEWMAKGVLRAYFEGLNGGALFATIGQFALPDTSTEEAMQLTSKGPVIGTAVVITDDMDGGWRCWRVRDGAEVPIAKGTKCEVRGVVTYKKSYTGYLILRNGEDHILPSKDVSEFTVKGG